MKGGGRGGKIFVIYLRSSVGFGREKDEKIASCWQKNSLHKQGQISEAAGLEGVSTRSVQGSPLVNNMRLKETNDLWFYNLRVTPEDEEGLKRIRKER